METSKKWMTTEQLSNTAYMTLYIYTHTPLTHTHTHTRCTRNFFPHTRTNNNIKHQSYNNNNNIIRTQLLGLQKIVVAFIFWLYNQVSSFLRASCLQLHNILNVPRQYGVLHYVKHYFNVLGVRGGGEVPVELLCPILSHRVEHLYEKRLHVAQVVGVTLQLKTIVHA